MAGTTRCMHCSGQMPRSASECPWCHHGRGSSMLLELFFGAVVAVGVGTIAALATGVLTGEQVTSAVGGLADRIPAPKSSETLTASALLTIEDEPATDVRSRSERVQRQAARVSRRGCADPTTVQGLVERYQDWADGDLALIACGRIRSGFSRDQVVASMGEPRERLTLADSQEQWRYSGRRVILQAGQVVALETE